MALLVRHLLCRRRARTEHTAISEADASGSGATRAAGPAAHRPRPTAASRGLLALETRYDLKTSLRNPRARFFTFIFPIVLLVIFAGVFHGTTKVDGVHVTLARFFVPGILAMSIVNATFSNLVISISALRETGVLKRRRATPVPPAILVAGQALCTLVIAAVMATILLTIARIGYGVGFGPAATLAIACTVIVGALTFACLGYAVSGLIGSPEAAQPIVQATTLPLMFISGIFIPTATLNGTLRAIASLFPVEHLANGLHLASVNSSLSGAISSSDLLVLAVWGLGGAAFAAWRFSWLPSGSSEPRGRHAAHPLPTRHSHAAVGDQ